VSSPHRFDLRIYFEDTDTGGIVYYANYLRFAERARTEMLREAGFESSKLMASEGIALAVRRATADYQKPARLDDLVTVETEIEEVKGASLRLSQVAKRGEETLVVMSIQLAAMDGAGRPKRLPEDLKSALSRYLASKGPH